MYPARITAERSARRFFFVAACILAAISLAAFLIPLTLGVPPRVAGAISWRPTALGATVLISLLLWGRRGAWLILAAGVCLFELPPLFSQAPSPATLATLGQTLLTGLVIGFVGAVVLRLSRSADLAAAARERAAAAAAAAAGAGAARAKAAALVHDEVLSTLNLAASPHRVDGRMLAEQAARARELLIDASAEEPIAGLLETLRQDVGAIDPTIEFEIRGHGTEQGSPDVELPAAALSAVRSGVHQALRNSLLHAGHSARRRVTIAHDPAMLRVIVADDGIGFDPAQVSLQRLGLRTTAQAVRSIGGEVEVSSGPGSGTLVRIEWPGDASPRTAPGTPGTAAEEPSASAPAAEARPEMPRLGEVPLVRAGIIVTATAFAVTQTMLAAVATATATPHWVPFAALALLFTAALLLCHRDGRFGPARTALVLCLICGAVAAGLLGAPFEVGHLWFAGASAFLLTALSFRRRPITAAAGGLLVSAMLVLNGVVEGAPSIMITAIAVRPLGVICFAVGLTFAVRALLRRIGEDLTAAEAESAREAWARSAREELAARAGEVRELVDEILERVASETPLTDQDRARAAALEGRLRDRIRAGRLAVEPLLVAAGRARERGVDVLLLDDREEDLPERFDLALAATGLVAACDRAREQVTVRLLPAGRSAVLSLVVDGSPVALLTHTPADTEPF